jgi:sulfotransferase family protein
MENFIISTGRSGSTLLSRMVSQNRHVLMLSEFIAAMDQIYRFKDGIVDGDELAAIMTTSCEISRLVRARGHKIEEILSEAESTLAHIVCPALSSEPDKLYEEIIAFARVQPPRLIGDHYRALFAWLCDMLGKKMWIERSGMTVRVMAGLRRTFPNARYLHISRDGVETALSMYHHPWFHVAAVYDAEPPSVQDVIRSVRREVSESEDVVSRHFERDVPLEVYGNFWSTMICAAYHEIAKLDRDQFHDLPHEKVLSDPRAAMQELAQFFELPDDPGWIDRAAALVQPDRGNRARALPEQDRLKLANACRPGMILLGRETGGRLPEVHRIMREAFEQAGVQS